MIPGHSRKYRLSGKLTWSVKQPWAEPGDDRERVAKQKALDMIEKLKARCAAKAAEEDRTKKEYLASGDPGPPRRLLILKYRIAHYARYRILNKEIR